MTTTPPAPIHATAASRSALAHQVLLRYLPSLDQILTVASFCHLYTGRPEPTPTATAHPTFAWAPCICKGALFIVSTHAPSHPYYIIILNRIGSENFIWPISTPGCIEFDPDAPLQLLLRDDESSELCYGVFISEGSVQATGEIVVAAARAAVEKRDAVARGVGGRTEDAEDAEEDEEDGVRLGIEATGAEADVLGRLFENARQRNNASAAPVWVQ